MDHKQKHPYPYKVGDKWVLNELCRCGAMRTMHRDTVAFGHGACPITNCEKFTWARYIFEGS